MKDQSMSKPKALEVKPAILDLVEDTQRTWERLVKFDLLKEVAELNVKGYCVIPPEKVGPMSDVVEAREALLDLARKEGAMEKGLNDFEAGLAYALYHCVSRGRIFEKWAVNPTVLAIARYLVGERMILNNNIAWVKGKTEENLGIHTDTLMVPDPLLPYLSRVNVTVVMTDYTLEEGCLGVVPGSHREQRHPTVWEEKLFESMVPVECPAGSLIIIPGNTWHGAFPKKTDGLRVSMSLGYSRIFSVPAITHDIDPEILARNGDDFRMLMGGHLWTRFGPEGPALEKHFETYRTQRSQYA